MPATAATRPEQTDALLRQALEEHGQRYTEQRAAVFRFLAGSCEHPSADEVFTSVRGEIPDISLATVYKALETLVSCGLAVKLTYGDGSARFDARTDDHYHSRCLRCGIVRDVPGESMEMPRMQVGEGFRVEGFRLEVVGYCPGCAATLD
jgi:Fur family transcriptional regulator, peroxide stress response regulator